MKDLEYERYRLATLGDDLQYCLDNNIIERLYEERPKDDARNDDHVAGIFQDSRQTLEVVSKLIQNISSLLFGTIKRKEFLEKYNVEPITYTQSPKDTNIPYQKIIDYLNKVAGTKYKHTSRLTRRHIKARWNEGFRDIEQYESVIDAKWRDWGSDDRMKEYVRPQTLFGTNFESYLQKGNLAKKLNCNSCFYKNIEKMDCWKTRTKCDSYRSAV